MTPQGPVGPRCSLVRLPRFTDERGSLVVGELGAGLPFTARRFFVVSDVPAGASRGGHANQHGDELLVVVRGSVSVEVDDELGTRTVVLDDPAEGLHLPATVWSTQTFGEGAVMLVLASAPYDPSGVIPDRDAARQARAPR